MAARVCFINWRITTICEHICANEALTGACISICVDKPSDCRVVVARLQIVEAGFVIVVVPAIAKGVEICKGGAGGLLVDEVVAAAVDDAGQLAPCAVFVFVSREDVARTGALAGFLRCCRAKFAPSP